MIFTHQKEKQKLYEPGYCMLHHPLLRMPQLYDSGRTLQHMFAYGADNKRLFTSTKHVTAVPLNRNWLLPVVEVNRCSYRDADGLQQ